MFIATIKQKYQQWWQNIDFPELTGRRSCFLFAGWIITFYFIIAAIESDNLKWMQVWIVFNIYFWYQVNRTILLTLSPPVGLLIISILSLSFLQNFLLSQTLKNIPAEISLGFFPTFLLALQILFMGFILVTNSSFPSLPAKNQIVVDKKPGQHIRQKTLIFYALIGYLAYQIVFFEYEYILYLFQFLLLLTLLNKTRWLESLGKRDLTVYFWIFLLIFFFYNDPSGLQTINFINVPQKVTWFAMPFYLHLLLKMYLLAVLIKIPIVVIYNHATLSRKLWIAGLFQSTIPQLIQFVFLCFIFFALISSWQAENILEAFQRQVVQIRNNRISPKLNWEKVTLWGDTRIIYLTDYLPYTFTDNNNPYGLMRFEKTQKKSKREFNKEDYYLFVKPLEMSPNQLTLIKLDTAFISVLAEDLSFLAGSGLIMYPFTPKEWQRLVFDLRFFQEDSIIKIYPFAILSLNESWSVSSNSSLADTGDARIIIGGREDIFAKQKFVVGRMFLPVTNASSESMAYFAFDTYLNIQSLRNPSVIGRALLTLIVIFILFNSLVIRQVGKFGSKINEIIIQKFSQLKLGIQQIAKGNLDYKFLMDGEDEFVELAGHFNEMSDKLKKTIAEAREKDRLDHELKIARQVQLSLLPAILPEITDFHIAASLKTANEIGGDLYDIVPAGKHQFLFTIGDVSGKGSSAAFYMAQYISLLRYSCQFTTSPDEIAVRINNYFSTQIADRQIFITAIIGILDTISHQIDFVRAGHMLPILIPGDLRKKIIEIPSKGIGIGLTKTEKMFKKKIELERIVLQPGDMLVFYTDGVVEAAHPHKGDTLSDAFVEYGEKRFKDLLNISRGISATELISVCNQDLDKFYKGNLRVDDHTLLFLQRKE
jgi:serine phosphatase RsbU (regulator of sigma subunit)